MLTKHTKILRCSVHSYDFPPRREFVKCPECGISTTSFSQGTPMPADEANSILSHARFEAWLEKEGRT